MTLAFLGDVDGESLSVLKTLQLKGARHSLPIEQARYWKHNQIIWVGPEAVPEELAFLAQGLKDKLQEKNFRTEERPFAAHVTLVRKARDPGELPRLPAVDWPVNEVVLVRSRLSSDGASYQVVQRYPLS